MIDKISLTLPLFGIDANPRLVHEIFEQITQDRTELERARDPDLFKNYRYAWLLRLDEENHCVVQYSPRGRNTNFTRLEWNPAKVGARGMNRIRNFLAECLPSIDEAINNARITRIDLAFDVWRVHIDSILIFAGSRKPNSRAYFQSNGRLNALEIGLRKSNRFFKVYDKRLNDIENGKRRIAGSKTRFELSLKDIGGWAQLETMQNPFPFYSVLMLVNIGGVSTDHTWQWFVDSCKGRGAQAAISLIQDRRQRKAYQSALRELDPPNWFDPDSLWSELPDALNQIRRS
jgi:hypothetical protein